MAFREIDFKHFLDNLSGDRLQRDGQKIYEEIKSNLDRSDVSPQVKKDKLLSQFSIIGDDAKINEINDTLEKTP